MFVVVLRQDRRRDSLSQDRPGPKQSKHKTGYEIRRLAKEILKWSEEPRVHDLTTFGNHKTNKRCCFGVYLLAGIIAKFLAVSGYYFLGNSSLISLKVQASRRIRCNKVKY